MNWLASLVGAFVVAAAGLAVGAALGHEQVAGPTRTVTVLRRVYVKPPSGTTGPSTTPGGLPTTGPTGSRGSTRTVPAQPGGTVTGPVPNAGPQQMFFSEYMSQHDTSRLDQQADQATFDPSATTLELDGTTYAHAVAFDVPADPNGNMARYQVPIAGFSHFASVLSGLDTTASASASFNLTIYKDTADNPTPTILYQHTFVGPSGTYPMNFDTQNATDLVFVWTEKPSGEPNEVDQFIIADPILTAAHTR